MRLMPAMVAIWLTCLSPSLLSAVGKKTAPPLPAEVDPFRLDPKETERVPLIRAWQQLARTLQQATDMEKLTAVNRFFNQRLFASDQIIWGRKDYWATPTEFLSRNAGDCEDFAISKYFTLRALGIEDDKLYLTYVRALTLNQAHMVLIYFKTPDATPLVLDNLDPEIKPATQRHDLVPIYSFNGTGLWRAQRNHNKGRRLGPSLRLHKWHSLLARIQRKGP